MKLYLQLENGEPFMLFTSIPHTDKEFQEVEVEYVSSSPLTMTTLFVVYQHPRYHIFKEMVDALHFALHHEIHPGILWQCAIDEFQDRDEIPVESITRLPLHFISGLEIKYRMHNPRMTAVEAFQEAIGMWKIFGPENIRLLRQLINKYPDANYDKQYEHHLIQHDLLMGDTTWTSLSEFLDANYPAARHL